MELQTAHKRVVLTFLKPTSPCRHTPGVGAAPTRGAPAQQPRGRDPRSDTPLDATSTAHNYTLGHWAKGTCSSVGLEPPKPADVS